MDEVDPSEMPGAVVREFLEREDGVRTLLDDLEMLTLEGRHGEVRDRIRTFAEESQPVFFTVALALTGSKHFFGDVESQLGVGPADRLRDLSETYPALADPFSIVRMEVSGDRHNPVTGLDVTTTYHAEEQVPMVAYTAHSGEAPLFDAKSSPQEVLGTATFLVQATNDALDAALEGDHPINTDELSELIDRREELESELSVLRDRIDDIRQAPLDE
jgi:hypothetical protein